ncbi:MAG: carboxylating nicotinate-nucleotide diphosphorylase [Clostridia bacterium]|nr:carboxylating nicotinate-nucleotide diphosphorylase [Clostridia bacterium]
MTYTGFDDFLISAIKEDVGTGDVTTEATIPADAEIEGRYIAKDDGIICGTDVCRRVFELVGGEFSLEFFVRDGDAVKRGDVIGKVSGNARSVLTGERLGLNIMQHLSGIATKTRYYVDIIEGTGARIADTRKATPGMRVLEKYAVRVGGGVNHRMNLSDGVLIKDNHIVAAGGIKNAVAAAKRHAPHTLKIEVETENEDEIREALEAGADIIMLDNMTLDKMAEAVKLINRRAIVEASGNMGDKSAEELRKVALTGVDLISIGALTHSVKAFDISLKFTIKTN